ncbi:FAD-binding and (Fe-S)-binding domain-containing protein [Rubrobacter aplysinae]|uniref:FAD-binding and (Fe-S)-binding domain-containing protein n=1 Tax=Rubrobacter aplysinae TaxID=909625 RepID=UPI00069FE0F3|nr:FAD-binding and (Fe-S)-binding domain-containing protein [Rubrobacter aplysinae]
MTSSVNSVVHDDLQGDLQDLQGRLHAALDGRLDGGLYTDDASRSLWSTDASIYLRRPEGVVVARSEEDVRLALAAARELGLAITPRGTGTSLAGQATAPGLALDVSGMCDILEVDVENRRCVVEPGVIQGELNARVASDGLVFGADTSTSDVATLGGMVGNDSAGMRSVVYGTTADQILSLRCILANGETAELRPMAREEAERRARENEDAEAVLLRGALEIGERHHEEIRRRFPEMIRRVSGYGLDALVEEDTVDLTRLVCGSEGTLALVTRAELRLHPLPAHRALASFQFDSLALSARATVELLEEEPSAIELLDEVAIRAAREAPAYRESTSFVRGEPRALLLVEWSGDKRDLDRRFEGLEELGNRVGATEVVPLRGSAEMAQTVKLRKSTLPLLLGTNNKEKPVAFVEDAAVPPDRLEEFITRFEEIVHRNGTWACFYGHASVGTLHVRPALDTREPEGVARMRRIGEEVAALVRELGGSISGEHGDGLSRSEFLTMLYGEEIVTAFGEVKRLFDLGGVLNPGVIVDVPPVARLQKMDENLRIGPGHKRLPLKTGLDFSAQGGFHHAVELCNGSGFCRKKSGGTMCPSYMATLQEEDTTRARANMLRSVLDGTLPPEELTGDRMKEVMDLCVGCKACKSECPSQVDVASMKTEVLYQTGKEHGFSLRQKGAGHVRRSLALASKTPRLYNALASTGLARRAASLAGIDSRRNLPKVTEKVFSRRFPRLPQGAGAEVALFNDTWNEYQRPEIGEGAVRVLAAAGARVSLPEVVCCGRPMLSEGLIDEARKNARRNLGLLTPLIDAGTPLVGLEPSCILTMRDDYAKLLPGDERVAKLAGLTRLFEEALLELTDAGAAPDFKEGPPVLLHGHCHQKALVGTGPMERALALSGAEVETVDSGCCGMAGLFGYEKGHYEASMQMGERKLLPAVRESEDREVVAPGTSCREQISDGAGRRALHPAEYLGNRLPR